MNKRLRVYIESTIPGYITGRVSPLPEVARKQVLTVQWNDLWADKCDLFKSKYTVAENEKGDSDAARRRLDYLANVVNIDVDDTIVPRLALSFVGPGSIPEDQLVDALHVATATVYGMDVLLTWNCNHINNPITLPEVYKKIYDAGYNPPLIMTPEQFMEAYK